MNLSYTARAVFDPDHKADDFTWTSFVRFSRLSHLKELVSLDPALNEVLVERDYNDERIWEELIVAAGDDPYDTGCFKTEDYVLRHIRDTVPFNFLAVAIDPQKDCCLIVLPDYDFLGYELLDNSFDTSALSNCGGFDKTFLPGYLNSFGLIDNYEKAVHIQKQLLIDYPEENRHADTVVIAIWRHRKLGRGTFV